MIASIESVIGDVLSGSLPVGMPYTALSMLKSLSLLALLLLPVWVLAPFSVSDVGAQVGDVPAVEDELGPAGGAGEEEEVDATVGPVAESEPLDLFDLVDLDAADPDAANPGAANLETNAAQEEGSELPDLPEATQADELTGDELAEDETPEENAEDTEAESAGDEADTSEQADEAASEDTASDGVESEETDGVDEPVNAQSEDIEPEDGELEDSALEETEGGEETAEADEEDDSGSGLASVSTIPLQSSVDRFDIVEREGQTLVAVGLLQEQSVALVDLASGEIVAQTGIGFEPNTVRYDPVNNVVYAAGLNSDGLVVLEGDTLEIRKGYGLGAGVLDIDFDGETGRIFATHPNLGSISIMQLSEESARTLPVPMPPLAIAFNPVTNNLLITADNDTPLGLLVLNADNGELLAMLRSGIKPEDIALEPESQRLVVLNSGTSDLTVFDRQSSGEAVQTIGLNWRPTRVALSSDGQYAYITSRDSNHLQVADLETGELQAVYDLGESPIGVSFLPTENGPAVLVAEAGEPQLNWVELPAIDPEAEVAIAPRPDTGSAAGRVVDLAGNPVSGGIIRLKNLRGDAPDTQLNLFPDGSFLIPNLPTGVYLADISVPGFPTVSSQIQVRSGFVSSTQIQLPPGRPPEDSIGIGVIPDREPFSDDLAAQVHATLQDTAGDRPVELLIGPIGVWEEFQQLAPLAEGLDIIDRDNRFTPDLDRLKVSGNSLGLRYIVLTHMDISREFDRRGNPFLNLAIRYFVPQVPVNIPDFTPNELRSRGVMIVVDLQEDEPGDLAGYYEAFDKDEVGGNRMFEDAAAGLFRRQAESMVPDLLEQWQEAGAPFS
ncbi:MAG: hypothetical protein AAGA40_14885 [Cyanobacteria bacterium P01_E01_bin.45]